LGYPSSSADIAAVQIESYCIVKKTRFPSPSCEMVVVGVSIGALMAVAEEDGYKGTPIRPLLSVAPFACENIIV
jgi:hypothetical protein